MYSCLYCSIFCRQAKCVISHRIKHIKTTHSQIASYYIAYSVVSNMSHVQKICRRIRKHFKYINFFLRSIFVSCKNSCSFPAFLPLFFNFLPGEMYHLSFPPQKFSLKKKYLNLIHWNRRTYQVKYLLILLATNLFIAYLLLSPKNIFLLFFALHLSASQVCLLLVFLFQDLCEM